MNANTESWPRPHRLSVDDYHRMAEVGLLSREARVELIEGAIVDMAPVGSRHAALVDRLAKRLIEAVGEEAIVGIQRPMRLGSSSEPQPDLMLLRPCADSYAGSHPTAADALLIVEVSDATLRFDREVKAPLYARHVVPEVWIVDIPGRQVHRLRQPDGAEYRETAVASEPGVVTIAAAPLCIDLTRLFVF